MRSSETRDCTSNRSGRSGGAAGLVGQVSRSGPSFCTFSTALMKTTLPGRALAPASHPGLCRAGVCRVHVRFLPRARGPGRRGGPARRRDAGVKVKPWLDVEAEVMRPTGSLRREHSGFAFSFAPPGSSRDEIERLGVLTRFVTERRVSAGVSAGVAFHAREDHRVQPRASSASRITRSPRSSTRTPLQLPPGCRSNRCCACSRSKSATAPAWRADARCRRGHCGHPPADADAGIRYDYGSIGDEINDVARPGIRVLWRF